MILYAGRDEPTVVCDHCGARFREARQACPRCGAARVGVEPGTGPSPGRGRRPETALAASGLGLAAIVVVGAMAWPSDPGPTTISQASMLGLGQPSAVARSARPAGTVVAPEDLAGPPAFLDAKGAGTVAYTEGRVEDALERFREVLEKNQGDPEALNNVGQVLVRLGRASEALPYLEEAASRFPDRLDFQFNLARALGEAGRWPEAVDRYRGVAARSPDDDVTAFNLARALERAGQSQEAIAGYERAVRLAPNDPSFHLALALAHERAGDLASARPAYEGYLALLPEGAEAEKVRLHLAALPPPAEEKSGAPGSD